MKSPRISDKEGSAPSANYNFQDLLWEPLTVTSMASHHTSSQAIRLCLYKAGLTHHSRLSHYDGGGSGGALGRHPFPLNLAYSFYSPRLLCLGGWQSIVYCCDVQTGQSWFVNELWSMKLWFGLQMKEGWKTKRSMTSGGASGGRSRSPQRFIYIMSN